MNGRLSGIFSCSVVGCFLINERYMSIFHRFAERDLQEAEVLVYRMHPHLISFLRRGRAGFFWMLVGVLLFVGLTRLVGFDVFDSLEVALFVLLISGIPLFVGLLITVKQFLDLMVDEGIVTNKRVISVDQEGFFHHQASSVDLAQVSDVVVNKKGVLDAVFNIGTLDVKTSSRGGLSSAQERTLIRDVSRPKNVHQLLDKLIVKRNDHGVDYTALVKECGLG